MSGLPLGILGAWEVLEVCIGRSLPLQGSCREEHRSGRVNLEEHVVAFLPSTEVEGWTVLDLSAGPLNISSVSASGLASAQYANESSVEYCFHATTNSSELVLQYNCTGDCSRPNQCGLASSRAASVRLARLSTRPGIPSGSVFSPLGLAVLALSLLFLCCLCTLGHWLRRPRRSDDGEFRVCSKSDTRTEGIFAGGSDKELCDVARRELWLLDLASLEVRADPEFALGLLTHHQKVKADPEAVLADGDNRPEVQRATLNKCWDVLVRRLEEEGPERQLQLNELRIMRRLQHPNVVRLHGLIGSSGLYSVTEHVTGCDFHSYVVERRASGSLEQQVCRLCHSAGAPDARDGLFGLVNEHRVLTLAAVGLYYLHTHSILHLNVRPTSVLVATSSEPPGAKLCHLTHSEFLPRSALRGLDLEPRPPDIYAAPELVLGLGVRRATDSFGMGALVLFALCGVEPTEEQLEAAQAGAEGNSFCAKGIASLGSLAKVLPVAQDSLAPLPSERPDLLEIHGKLVRARHGECSHELGRWPINQRTLRAERSN